MIKHFNSLNATQNDWKKLFNFALDAKNLSKSNKTIDFRTWKEQKLQAYKTNPYSSIYLLFDKKKIVAIIISNAKNIGTDAENQYIDYTCKNLAVLEKYQEELTVHLNLLNRNFKNTTFVARHPVMDQIAKQANFKVANEMIFFNLDFPKYKHNKKLFTKGAKAIKKQKLKYKFLTTTSLEEFQQIAKMYTTLMNDMERNNKSKQYFISAEKLIEHSKNPFSKSLFLFLQDSQDNFIGMSIVAYPRKKPTIVNQYMTGVLKKYRKQGLSTWLKMKMYEKLKTDLPKIKSIKTDCYAENLGIIHINKTLGFDTINNQFEYLYKNHHPQKLRCY